MSYGPFRGRLTNWNGRKPRLRTLTTYNLRLQGGLGIPNCATYYQAAQLASQSKYHASTECPFWVGIQAIDIFPLHAHSLLWMPCRDRGRVGNLVKSHVLKEWDSLKNRGPLEFLHHPLSLVLCNPVVLPGLDSLKTFQHWIDLVLPYKKTTASQGQKSSDTSK